jgi:two-component system, cell cycle response regulator
VGDAERTIKLELSEIGRPGLRRPVLVVIQGQCLGLTVPLTNDRTVIGRGSTADIVLRDSISSRQHAQISRLSTPGGIVEYYLSDMGSTNGTYHNGVRISSDQLLQDGDKISVGEHLLKFALLDESETDFQERIHQMIQRDELTGLRSRRSLFADLDREVQRAYSASLTGQTSPITVLMMDLDFFKKVNDGYGHLVGSQTIREVGLIIRDTLGSSDVAARFGGEEYLAYVKGTPEEGLRAAEEIRLKVEAHAFPSNADASERDLKVTISLGVASFPKDGPKALDLVQKADQALYRAKKSGRNQTCLYDPDLDRPDPAHSSVEASAIIYGPADAQ